MPVISYQSAITADPDKTFFRFGYCVRFRSGKAVGVIIEDCGIPFNGPGGVYRERAVPSAGSIHAGHGFHCKTSMRIYKNQEDKQYRQDAVFIDYRFSFQHSNNLRHVMKFWE